jgi:tRNA-2-methylthio-N6-dimethylallyladenosine synthase
MGKNRYYLIETMGCQMNERDSETIAGMLEELGYARLPEDGTAVDGGRGDDGANVQGAAADGAAETPSARADRARFAADLIVVNTCSVRENADNRFFGALGRIKKAKEADPDKIVAVCGCMTQQEHIVSRIRNTFPWVDIVFGAMNIEAFPPLLADVLEKRKGAAGVLSPARRGTLVDITTDAGAVVEGLPSRRKRPHTAFVNITYGCNNFCTYCIVPYTRGRERSRAPEAILAEARALAADGVKEITLLGQNVNSYRGVCESRGAEDESCGAESESCGAGGESRGTNGEAGETDFPALLHLLDDVPGLERIRFMTSHPKDLSDRLIDCFRESGDVPAGKTPGNETPADETPVRHLCPSIHLPVQSGSTEVLRRMNRGYTKEQYLSLIERLREARPDIVITTDFIVGFPGETDDDFEDTMDVIERARFDAAFTFLYSPRVGTPAASYEDRVPAARAHERFDRMVKRLNEITLEKNRAMLGKTYDVLIEGPSKTDPALLSGRTPGGKLVNIRPPAEGGATNYAGRIVPMRLTETNTFSFIGEIAP